MVYTATVMTENAYYPIFLLAALALVALLERPSAGRYVAFFAVLGLAYLTRSQAVVVAAAALTAPLLLGLFRRGALRATLWTYRVMYAVFGGGAILVVAVQAARGRPLSALLGSYAIVGEAHYDVWRALHFVVYHLAELDLYVGVIPVAAAIVLTARARSLDEPLQVLLAATISLLAWTALVVGTFASRFADRIQERNMFALAPLLVILLLAWVERGAPRPRVLAALAAAAAALLVLAIPFDRFVTTSAVSDTLMLLPWWAIEAHTRITWLGMARVPRRSRLRVRLRARFRGGSRSCCRSSCLPTGSSPFAHLVRTISVRRPPGRRRRALSGDSGRRAGLDRQGRAGGLVGGGPLDQPQRPFHGEPERVLQPQGRPGLLHGPTDGRGHRRAAGLGRRGAPVSSDTRTAARCDPATS